eukprot:22431_1
MHKRKLSTEHEETEKPNLKKQKIENDNEEEKSTMHYMESSEFLSILSSDNTDSLCGIQELTLKVNDNLDYSDVLCQYLETDFEKLMPKLREISTDCNFLFNECNTIAHSKLEVIVITNCIEPLCMDRVNELSINYPSLRSVHAYCFNISENTFPKDHNLAKIVLQSALPTIVAYTENHQRKMREISDTEWNRNFRFNLVCKSFKEDVVDPRSLITSVDIGKDFTKIYCNDSDCEDIDQHISLVDSMRCSWCSMFTAKRPALDPKTIKTINGTKYMKDVAQYEYCDSEEKYLLQFPIGFLGEEEYFDGFVFWSGMPDEPEPEMTFDQTKLFRQNPSKFKPDTVYYLTTQQCKFLR